MEGEEAGEGSIELAVEDDNLSVTASLLSTLEGLPSVGAAGQYGAGYGSASYGSCFVSEEITPANPGGGSSYNDAGNLSVTGASPSPFSVPAVEQGVYGEQWLGHR